MRQATREGRSTSTEGEKVDAGAFQALPRGRLTCA